MLGVWQFDYFQLDAMRLGRVGGVSGLWAGGAPVDIGQADTLAGGGLHDLSQPAKLGAFVRAGRRDVQGLAGGPACRPPGAAWTPLALSAVIAPPGAVLRRGPQRAAVHDGSTGLGSAAGGDPQILARAFKTADRQPALRLLIDRHPGRQVVRHAAPQRLSPYQIVLTKRSITA